MDKTYPYSFTEQRNFRGNHVTEEGGRFATGRRRLQASSVLDSEPNPLRGAHSDTERARPPVLRNIQNSSRVVMKDFREN